eukprot:TRINITY_DN8173_c0_g1_i1.p1 TRINITY_DN8173_c0_g1~~TRINITY_DN8173_c0_g1_i1.p1  ORF type:complete len:944 (-),score=81.25 TRINITY_DN8173_c0_g1_i1:100-2931(-)
MLRADTNYPLWIGFIHDDSFHSVKGFEVHSQPTLIAKQNTLCLKLGDIIYSFAKRNLKRFHWCSTSGVISFEWDYNTGPKIHEDSKRTTRNPLQLNSIECNALSFQLDDAEPGARRTFEKIFHVTDRNLPVIEQKQHEVPVPDDLPLIVGLYLETLLSCQIPRGRVTANFFKVLHGVTVDEAISALISMKKYRTMILNPTDVLQRELQSLKAMDPEDWPSTQQKKRQKKTDSALVFQLDVTPAKVYVIGPILEKSNRILRKYWKYRDHFVRVRFADEDGSPMHASETAMGQHIYDKLYNGIPLAGCNFSFLAWSNSQLRGHSCFLFTKIVDEHRIVTNKNIIDELGEFWDDSAAKRGSRIGQCLTATVGGIRISVNKCEVIKDVTRNGFVFSDGVGTASYGVMELVQKRLKLPEVPSAIQIRYGGAKGVLSLDDRLPALIIRLRPSMQKFDSKHKELEITGHSTYRTAYLNRQMITLLQSLGTSTASLQKLEQAMTAKIDKLAEGVINQETLNQLTWGHSKAMLSEAIETFGLEEPFLRALVNKHSSKALVSLIKKTRIFIPNSAFAMGVLDEYGCLEEGEVFYQGLTDTGEKIQIVGDVLVTRSPCVHSGDMRKLKAVHRYELSHHYNVLVFSRKGQRPIPNMISGGDLDGDHYSIIAEKSIFPKRTVTPMDYTPKATTTSGFSSWPEGHINFFVHYIANDNLGKIANQWLAQCELQERGALSSVAVTLAHKHAISVDFPKTGISATIPEDCKTSVYPDYMGKSPSKSFKAKSFIGQSFRRVTAKYGDPFQVSDFELEVDDDLSSYPSNEDWIDEALDTYKIYCFEMQSLINDFGAASDVDIVTGILPRTSHKRYRGKKYNAVEKLGIAFEDLKTRFLQRFKQGITDHEDKLAKASAWYRVVYELVEEPAFASFAWILAKYLVEIKGAANVRRMKRNRRNRY